jgi:hypothetical protein
MTLWCAVPIWPQIVALPDKSNQTPTDLLDAVLLMPGPVPNRCHIINQTNDHLLATHSMKRQIEKPSEQIMRYFTPHLYLLFNSQDDLEADLADAQWEQAIQKYQEHLEDIRERLPLGARQLAELLLHDAEVLSFDPEAEIAGEDVALPMPLALLTLGHGGEILSLIYSLWDGVRESPAPTEWPFTTSSLQWLYDELDAVDGPSERFMHRILLSDGTSIEIPFHSVLMRRARRISSVT